jgi:carbamate kinase
MARGVPLVLTHGNGPQVGFMQLRSELARGTLHEVPLDSLVADSQGSLGYMLQLTLRESLEEHGRSMEVISVVTEVEVDPDDPAMTHPTKPIGRFYSQEEAQQLASERGWRMVEDSRRGYRRVVPSPKPHRILQLDIIKRLVESGVMVIACGGGGIPVVARDGHHRGLEAVIDKDHASALLAAGLGARRLIITTGIDTIFKDYLTDHPTPLPRTDVAELSALHAAGQFPPGSMGPKVEAAIHFLEAGGEEVLICRPERLLEAVDGLTGTRIVRKLPRSS